MSHYVEDQPYVADDDPFEDDLTEQLAARAPRRLANRATVVLAGLVLLIGGVVAGGPGGEELCRPPAPAPPAGPARGPSPRGAWGGGGRGGRAAAAPGRAR